MKDTAKGKSAQTFMERMKILTDILTGVASIQDLPPFTVYLSMPEGYKAPGGASQNYKSMGRFSRYVYELIMADGGDSEDLRMYRTQTLNYFKQELEVGQMITEQGCSAPHDGMHIARALLARLASIIYGDSQVEEASREWLSGFLAMCLACSYNGHVVWPGFRIKKSPESQVRDIVYQVGVGTGTKTKPKLPKKDKLETDRFFLGGRLIILLSELEGGIPEPAKELPKLWAPMKVAKVKGGGFVAWIPEKPEGIDGKGIKECVDWVLYTADELDFGIGWGVPFNPQHQIRMARRFSSLG